MGRPKLNIDGDHVFRLAKVFCTNAEIAEVIGCSTDTIERRFAAEIAKGRAVAKRSLRRAQLYYALKGNSTMLVWLGKQMLGQADRLEVADVSDDRNAADPEVASKALEAAERAAKSKPRSER